MSAVESGIRTLPMVMSLVAASISTGALISRIGYYTPVMIVGVCLLSAGAGLLTTLQPDTPQAQWVGYQFLYGFGLGCTFQAPNLAAQTVLPNKDVPIGTSLMFFSQLLGGAIFISVGQNVLNNQLLQRLTGLPGFSPSFLQNSGATSLTNLPPQVKDQVTTAYNESLRKVFQVGLILACLVILGAATLEWRSVKKNQEKAAALKDNGAGAEEGRSGTTAGQDEAAATAAEKRIETDDENERADADLEKDRATSERPPTEGAEGANGVKEKREDETTV